MIIFPFLDEIVILLDLFWCIYKENFAVVKCLLHCCNETKSKNLFGLKLRYSVHQYQYQFTLCFFSCQCYKNQSQNFKKNVVFLFFLLNIFRDMEILCIDTTLLLLIFQKQINFFQDDKHNFIFEFVSSGFFPTKLILANANISRNKLLNAIKMMMTKCNKIVLLIIISKCIIIAQSFYDLLDL